MGYCHRPQVHQGDRRETLSLADSEIPASPDGHPRSVFVQTVPVLLEPLQCPEIYTILISSFFPGKFCKYISLLVLNYKN